MKPSSSYTDPGKSEQSTEKLAQYFSALNQADHSASRKETDRWLYETNIKLENSKRERKTTHMKNYFLANKLRLVYPVLALAILIAACSMPVTQTETLGHVVSWSVDKSNTESAAKINSLSWLNAGNLNANENTNNGRSETLYTLTLSNSTDKQVEGYVKELQSIPGISMIKAVPINNDVKRPLYSAALYKFFSIDINAKGMSDEELQKEITRQMKEQGVDLNVKVWTNEKGHRQIMMNMPEGSNKNGGNFELKVNDGNQVDKMKIVHKVDGDPDRFKGKTDDEIRKMVKEDVGNPNLKDSDIKISRENGNVMIKVEATQEDVK